jgi:DNA helicase II / ATP-dependent DNA helicase PcrA
MSVEQYKFQNQFQELAWVKSYIQTEIKNGCEASEIAVIARRHGDLKNLVKVLNAENIPYAYDRGSDILNNPIINEIIQMMRFSHVLATKTEDEADEFLPEILCYPFWGLEPAIIWDISLQSHKNKLTWLEVMYNFKPQKLNTSQEQIQLVKNIASFLILSKIKARDMIIENFMDFLVGVDKAYELSEGEEEGFEVKTETKPEIWRSPFKKYYFDRQLEESIKNGEATQDFFDFLVDLQTLSETIKNHSQNQNASLSDLIKFLDLAKRNHFVINSTRKFKNHSSCVQLMTAHKAKGLEFKKVILLFCQQEVWVGKKHGRKIGFPNNLPLLPEDDDIDDKLRLFYVACTRARENLILLSSEFDLNGKNLSALNFVPNLWEQQELGLELDFEKVRDIVISSPKKLQIKHDLKLVLKPELETYQLSVTHLLNFIDIANAGPHKFLETNLLRFPEAKSFHAVFGTLIHDSLREFYIEFKKKKELPKLSFLIDCYQDLANRLNLNNLDLDRLLQDGKNYLPFYYSQRSVFFDLNSWLEVDFRTEQVVLNKARITGKIDKIDKDDVGMKVLVSDFKTGKSFNSWKQNKESDKLKLWKYRLQLVFYKLLVENSREFSKYKVDVGILEFIQKDDFGKINLLETEITPTETENLTKLIGVVYRRILDLDFPDTSSYSPNLKGMLEFVEVLINEA